MSKNYCKELNVDNVGSETDVVNDRTNLRRIFKRNYFVSRHDQCKTVVWNLRTQISVKPEGTLLNKTE